MESKSDRRTIPNSMSSQAALQKIYVVDAVNRSNKRSISQRWKVRLKPSVRLLLLCVPLLCAAATFAQYNPLPTPIAEQEVAGPAQAAVHAGPNNPVALSQNPYLGGVPAGELSATPVALSLQDAVTRGLRQNLGGFLASDSVTDARGEKWQALSELLPNVITNTGFGIRQIDLKAQFGLNIPGVPKVIGPFGYFDSRAYLNQTVFDWESIQRMRSSQAQLKSAEYGVKNARELVVTVIVSNYLLVIADQSEVDSARSQRDTAKVLFQQTSDQHTAGLAAAVDVLRSQVELQSREQKLIVAQNNWAKQKLVLARAIGLPRGQMFDITTQVSYQDLSIPPLNDAIESAFKARPDFQSQMSQVQSAELVKKASSAERYPSIEQVADYGITGVNPASTHGTVDAAVTLRVPIFQGGKVHADVLRADASLQRAKQVLEDMRAQIDQEVRDAYLDLESAAQEVSVEKTTVTLATETLRQSRDRFSAGVTDNIEVVQAQDALATANDAYIASLYSYNLAKISLARAIGVAESRFAEYLKGDLKGE
ncbi:MAG: TolC family protein [Candidatus Acidiferrales bacterium]|jgi:outer membrane protein TolC